MDVTNAERVEYLGADELAEVAPGNRLDDDSGGPVGGGAVVLDFGARPPLQLEVADLAAKDLMVGPGLGRGAGARETALVGEQLEEGNVTFTVGRELRNVVGDAVVEAEGAALD